MMLNLEVTDTFGGEANYSWVERRTVDIGSKEVTRYGAVRLAKKFAGITGEKCEVEDYGDELVIRPVKRPIVVFVSYQT